MRLARFSSQMHLMTPQQLRELSDSLLVAGMVYETNGDWREVFRRKKIKYKAGYLHRLYKMLHNLDYETVDRLCQSLTEEQS